MPGNLDGVIPNDLHLACLRALWQNLSVQAGLNARDAVGVVGRQVTINVGERSALESEDNGLGDLEESVFRQVPVDIELFCRIALRRPNREGDRTERQRNQPKHWPLEHGNLHRVCVPTDPIIAPKQVT